MPLNGYALGQLSAQPKIQELALDQIPEDGEYQKRSFAANEVPLTPDNFKSFHRYEKKTSKTDFELLRVLGQGSFGKVFLVSKRTGRDIGHLYAMKVLRKAALKVRDRERTKMERNILVSIDHPFIVKVYYAFQTDDKLYLVLEFVRGGDLFTRLSKEFMFTEKDVKFYLAELVLAIGHVHSLGIIYRDLKPENILLAEDGHIKLVDFGLSKENPDTDDKTFSFCGTVEYMAPEVVSRRGHTQTCDWWSYGVLMYEMLTGQLPFQGQNRKDTIQMILKAKLGMPHFLEKTTQGLLRVLFKRNPANRLGAGDDGLEKMKKHEYFSDIDWNKLMNKACPPPFVPVCQNDKDPLAAAFDTDFTKMVPTDTPGPPASVGAEKIFRGFSYRADVLEDLKMGQSNRIANVAASGPLNIVQRVQTCGAMITNHRHQRQITFQTEYDQGETIGMGGFAECYKCKHKKSGKEYAVKIINKAQDRHVYDEVEIMSKVSQHPNIVKLYDLFEDKERVYIVMEYLRGGELYDKIIKQKVFSEKEASSVILQIANVLSYLHKNNIVHRDLKPSNILYADNTNDPEMLRVSDFGFAKLLRHDNGMLMTPCFTANFVAPEVLKKQGYDKSCDMWSLGVILYVMLVGKLPFQAQPVPADPAQTQHDPSEEILNKIQNLDIHSLTTGQSWSMISKQGCDLVERLLCKDSSKRITAVEVLHHTWIREREHLPEYHLPVKKITKEQQKEFSNINHALRPSEKDVRCGNTSTMKLNMSGALIKKRGKKVPPLKL